MKKWTFVLMVAGCSLLLFDSSLQITAAVAETSSLRVVELRSEHRVNPIGIDEAAPLLSWQVEGATSLKSWQLRVASTREELEGGKVLWDSGEVAYSGLSQTYLSTIKLSARQSLAWQVRVWDNSNRVSPWSVPATFEMGLLAQ